MHKKNKELKIDFIILGLTFFFVVSSIMVLFGSEFYDEDVDIMGLPFGCYEVTFWVLSFTISFVFGIKAVMQSFKNISTNIIFSISSFYILYIALSMWNAYNEVKNLMAPFE